MNRFQLISSVATLSLGAMINVSGAVTQAQAQPEAGSPMLEEIIVTAQKRAENLQNVPITVNVVTAQQAAASGVTDSMSISAISPGVVILQTPGVPAIFVRGVGSQNTAAGEEGGNALYVDGVYYASTRAMIFDFNNIERIEVLKGPQGTLFGRNATGGLIHIITREPTTSPMFKASVGYANYGRVNATAYGATGLGDNLAVDLALNFMKQHEGYGRNLTSGREVFKGEQYGARTKLVWTPSDTTKLTVAADYIDDDTSFNAPRSIIPGSIDITGGRYLGDRYTVRNNHPYPHTAFEGGGASVRLDQGLGWSDFASITAYRTSVSTQQYDLDGTPVQNFDIYYHQPENQWTQELQLQAPSESAVKWIAGTFFLRSGTQTRPVRTRGSSQAAAGGETQRITTLNTRSAAVYAQFTAPIGFSTNLTAGVRYTKDKRHFFGMTVAPFGTPVIRTPTDARASYDKVTYKVALDHQLADEVMVFGSVSRGFKSGIFNTANLTNPPARPETLDAFEAGIKSQAFDNRLRLNVAGFYYRYKDIQLNQVLAGVNFLFNAARARTYGLDIDLVATPISGLTLRGSANLLNGKYQDFPGAPATQPVAAPVPAGWTCATPSASALGGNKTCVIANAGGNTTTRSPKLTYNLAADYTRSTPVGPVTGTVSLYHNSGYFIEPDNRIRQKGYELVAARLSWRALNDRYGVSVWGKNLTNASYYANVSTSAGDQGTWQAPRTYGITLDVSIN